MSTTSAIALSGLKVAELRLQASAINVANALSDGPLPESAGLSAFPAAYTPPPLRINQIDTAAGGTSGRIGLVPPVYVRGFDPTAPRANANGLVARPNVDLASELVQQILARVSFAANAQVLQADAHTTAALLDIKV